MLSPNCIERCVSRIALMKFFPGSDGGACSVLAEEIATMCGEDQVADWLAKRFTLAYREWPGIQELRAFYCRAYRPLDGIEAESGVYDYESGGIPRELLGDLPGKTRLLPPSEVKAIEAGAGYYDPIGIDPELAKLVAETAEAAKMPERRPRTQEEIEAELYKQRKPITQADFDALKNGTDS